MHSGSWLTLREWTEWRSPDGESETLSAGEAYYLRPGHNVHIDADTEFVEFTPADGTPGVNTTLQFTAGRGVGMCRRRSFLRRDDGETDARSCDRVAT